MKFYTTTSKVQCLKLNNTFIERVPESKPVTKTMEVFFAIILALFQMDFGFFYGSKRNVMIEKLVIFTVATLLCAHCTIEAVALNYGNFKLTWQIKSVLQHYCAILILLFTPKIKFRRFLEKLHEIDLKIEIRSEKIHLDYKIILFFFISSVTCIILVKLNWDHFNNYKRDMALELPLALMYVACDVPLIVHFFIFSSIYFRIKKLKKFLKSKIFFEDNVISDKNIVVYSHRIYMSLVDLTESIKGTYDYIFMMTLITSVPDILGVIYTAVKEIKSDSKNAFYTVKFFMVVHIMVTKFAPALAAGCLSSAAHQIKVLLNNKLIDEKDPVKICNIWKFLNYIEARSFRMQVFTVIPLDASLPMTVLNMCCTYVIVLIQLTHLY